eukprot:1138316-Rhodomonas_salina.1
MERGREIDALRCREGEERGSRRGPAEAERGAGSTRSGMRRRREESTLFGSEKDAAPLVARRTPRDEERGSGPYKGRSLRRERGVLPATEPAGSASLERDEVVFGRTSRWGDERGELELFRQGQEGCDSCSYASLIAACTDPQLL